MPTIADIPTLAEAGLPGVSITGWHGIFAPAGTPPELLDRFEAAARAAAAAPRFAGRLETDGLEPSPLRSRAQWFTAVREEHGFWGRKIAELNLRLE